MTEIQIRSLVSAFYARVRADVSLGPIFEARLGDRWEAHQDTMCDFWSTVMLASGRYRGNPIQAHARVQQIDSAAFDRWMELFRDTAREVLPDPLAEDVVARAASMRLVLARHVGSNPVNPSGVART